MRTTFVFLTIALAGCSGVFVSSYDIVLKNISAEEIRDAHVEFGSTRFPGGVVVPNSSKSVSEPRVSIPKIVRVTWRTENGIVHKKNIHVARSLLKSSDGKGFRLVFTLSGSDVQLLVEDRGY